MLREIPGVRQDRPNFKRRWYQDDFFDFYTWHDAPTRDIIIARMREYGRAVARGAVALPRRPRVPQNDA
ncbi:MAG: hypothetical protein ABI547_10165 [Betaproteobacteria bacterium]